jgi:catechol 2,3-dioxygenase-like lactoylglutathione lyase family enzyme
MFSHVILGVDDLEASKAFYDAALGALGHREGHMMKSFGRVMYMTRDGTFGLTHPINGQPHSCGNGSTIGFAAESPEQVTAFHDAGVKAGGTSIEEAPGLRQTPFGDLYLAYLRDPAGNKVCAMYRPG